MKGEGKRDRMLASGHVFSMLKKPDGRCTENLKFKITKGVVQGMGKELRGGRSLQRNRPFPLKTRWGQLSISGRKKVDERGGPCKRGQEGEGKLTDACL